MQTQRRHVVAAGLGLASASILDPSAIAGALRAAAAPGVPVPSLFDSTRTLCFGRYALEAPRDTEQVFGEQTIDAFFERYPASRYPDAASLLRSKWQEVVRQARGMPAGLSPGMLGPIVHGPVSGASYLWLYKGRDEYDQRGDCNLYGAIRVGATVHLFRGVAGASEHIGREHALRDMTDLMRGMHAWDGRSVPRQPGVCMRGVFIEEASHRFQEIMSSGFYFPSLPDVSFSVLSNKNASVDGENGSGLLERVEQARAEQPSYPYRFLRRGKRTLHHLWDGEEVLARRADGVLEFDWELVGRPGDPARPSWFEIGLRTGVAHNQVGAASTHSLRDEQAVVLWDRLLENLKFRVAVPGATAESVALR